MGNASGTRAPGAVGSPVLAARASERVKVILVERAAYPLYRNERIDGTIVRCGLGRILEEMSRHDPGVDIDLNIVVNEAKALAATRDEGGPIGRVSSLRRLRSWVGRRQQQRIERRMNRCAQLPGKYPFIEAVHFRSDHGRDFGAYDFGYQLLREQGYRGDVLFLNSSLAGPFEHGWLLKYRGQFRRHPNVGLCGIGLNSHDTSSGDGPFAPHVQSYFLYTNMDVLEHAVGPHLVDGELRDELDAIRRGEIGVSERVLDAGYSITSPMFPEFAYRRGDSWAIPWGDLRYGRRLGLPINKI